MRWLRWIAGSLLAIGALLFALREAMYIDSFRHALFGLVVSDRTLHPAPPWYVEPDKVLANKIAQRLPGYDLFMLYQCDTKTCGFRGRFAMITFAGNPNGTVSFESKTAAAITNLLQEYDPRLPSQRPFQLAALQATSGSDGGAFIAAQVDDDSNDRANRTITAAINAWHTAWDKCRAEKRCPPKRP
jgi:hypothetical protein